MNGKPVQVSDKVIAERADLQHLFDDLSRKGYRLLGPRHGGGAIVYDEIRSVDDLPAGQRSEQGAGTYRLRERADGALFAYVSGPHTWKQFLQPPATRLWRAQRLNGEVRVMPEERDPPKLAFIGVRACEVHAIAILDTVLTQQEYADPWYKARRDSTFIVAVNCGEAGGTCFCASMNTGPKATSGFDLALTEIVGKDRHYFVIEVGTLLGAEVLSDLPFREATAEERQAAECIVAETAEHMGRTLETSGLKEILAASHGHQRWDTVALRCLTCANCTMVCPTCFCTTVEDTSDLAGAQAERWRKWDSCFTLDFSYIHGGSVRSSAKARYRQWMTHKLSTWVDQFGTSGCVGCGRCITWCPVGIDITEEARVIRGGDRAETPA